MNIAIIGQKGIPSRAGGVEIHVEELAKRFVREGNNVTVYCREAYCEKKYEKYNGINIKYIKSINTKHLDAITYTFLATVDAIVNNYEIIHYHALGPALLSFLPRIFRKKVVCTCHGLDWKREKWGKFAQLALKLGEIASIVFPNKTISVSKSISDYYSNKYKKDVVYIPNGIDEKKKVDPNNIISKYGLEKDEYILFLARLVPEKGAHYLIQAFNEIDTNKKLVIAGGSSHSDDYVKKITEMSKNNSNIIFTGFVSGLILEELYSNAYIYVLPSEIEGLPISLLEAMAYGQCCLVSDIQENLDVIDEYAISFKSQNIEDLKQKLENLINNKDMVERYKKNSERFILSKYNWDKICKNTLDVFENI